jgi:RNA-binding protein
MKQDLSQADKKKLRGIAQRMQPTLSVGKQGLIASVVKEIETALSHNELIKIRFNVSREPMLALCQAIENQTLCTCVGHVGKTASFYKEKED